MPVNDNVWQAFIPPNRARVGDAQRNPRGLLDPNIFRQAVEQAQQGAPPQAWADWGVFDVAPPAPADPPVDQAEQGGHGGGVDMDRLIQRARQQVRERAAQNDPVEVPAEAKVAVKKEPGVVKGKVLDLTNYFGKFKNRVYRVGLEVEGGWNNLPPGIDKPVHDGSVFRAVAPKEAYAHKGEIASGPMEPASMLPWIKKYSPQVVNETCGLHIHMSFKSARHYSMLMDSPDYQATLIHYLKKWGEEVGIPKDHCLWARLDGKDKYCRDLFWPDLQAIKNGKEHDVEREGNKPGHRYTIVNYCWGLGFETLEVRVLPMFDSPLKSYQALKKVVDVTNAYLAAVSPKTAAARAAGRFKVQTDLEEGRPTKDVRVVYI